MGDRQMQDAEERAPMESIKTSPGIVTIDGVAYVPKSTLISNEALAALSEALGKAWCNGYYDPSCSCDHSVAMFQQISDLLSIVNKELRFKP
jgi:hypothetical protein